MQHNVTLLDGALGTMLWELSGTTGDVWKLNLTQPETVKKLHTLYIEAGAQIIASNTFSANCFSTKKSGESVAEIVAAGVKIAKQAAQEAACVQHAHTAPDAQASTLTQAADTTTTSATVKVALDIGPLPELLDPYGDLTEEDCAAAYEEIITAGVQEHPDLIFFETFMDVEMLKIAVEVAAKHALPIFCSMTFAPIGKTMMGNSVSDMIDTLRPYPIAAIGLNCSDEPSALIPVIESFRAQTSLPLIFKPNAGLPQQQNGKDVYQSDESIFAQDSLPAAHLGEIHMGGCCGTSPAHIKTLKETLSIV